MPYGKEYYSPHSTAPYAMGLYSAFCTVLGAYIFLKNIKILSYLHLKSDVISEKTAK